MASEPDSWLTHSSKRGISNVSHLTSISALKDGGD